MTPPSAADRSLGAERTVDEGRAAVAEAEETAFGGTDLDVALGRAELEDRLAAVVTGSWWAESGPPVRVVTPRRTTRSSTARSTQGDEHVEVRLSDEQLTLGTIA